MRRLLLIVGLLILLAGGALGVLYFRSSGRPTATFRTEPVTKGDLYATVSATGTLEPEEVIDVGAQVAGLISQFGTGSDGKIIDYKSPVEAGTVLARIEDSLYKAKVDQAKAAVKSAEQQVSQAKAKLEQARLPESIRLARIPSGRKQTCFRPGPSADQTDKDWVRAKNLKSGDFDLGTGIRCGKIGLRRETGRQYRSPKRRCPKPRLLEVTRGAESNGERLDAQAAVSGAAEAAVATNTAMLRKEEVNLGYCTITSNVKGTTHRPTGHSRQDRPLDIQQPQLVPHTKRYHPNHCLGVGQRGGHRPNGGSACRSVSPWIPTRTIRFAGRSGWCV